MKLKQVQQELIERHIEELRKQKEIFQDLLKKEKEILKNKLDKAHLKSKLLVRKVTRKNKKIKTMTNLLEVLRNKNLIKKNTFNLLKEEFSNPILPIVQNEFCNKGKTMHAKRYSNTVKQFAVTLYYHSPKAYKYCRSAYYNFSFSVILISFFI